jgi:hypothetical protein
MRSSRHLRRWTSPIGFALVGLCFLLPFATVSCDGAKTTFTGLQLVTHTVPRGGVPGYDEYADNPCTTDISVCVEHRAGGCATAALVAALIGLALGLLGFVRRPGWVATVGLVAMLVLGLTGFSFLGGPDVHYLVGYDIACLLFLALGVYHFGLAVGRRRRRRLRRFAAVRTRSMPQPP